MRLGRLGGVLLLGLAAGAGGASGPRWVTAGGHVIAWYTLQPGYYTDPGDLSASVNHAAADALVASAAAVWNVPTSFLTPAYGGTLDEHVSGANTYLSSGGLVFPADVDKSNNGAKQIAVIYDTDGSVTDLLLGSGASDPEECAQNGVTGTVDEMGGQFIQHAILVLNGRCTGSAPEKQLQMQYQLIRAFGRIFGVAWSQLNDNVFVGSPSPTLGQATNWPIMHPIDIACGPYSYQCMLAPFTLRPDDVASISMLYGNKVGGNPPGKLPYLGDAIQIGGTVTFPTGQGMQGVNVVARRRQEAWGIPEDWQEASGVTGNSFRQVNSNPVSGGGMQDADHAGSSDPSLEGQFLLAMIPLRTGEAHEDVLLTTEPVNPLYTGTYAIGADGAQPVSPSGSTMTEVAGFEGTFSQVTLPFAVPDAAASCSPSADGTEAAPLAVDATGWWTGLICGYGHAAWSGMQMARGRSLTVEVTALDAGGSPATGKLMPVIGVWDATAATGAGPATETGVAATPSPFNSLILGMTNLAVASGQPLGLRMVLADGRGDGRPDFAYQARVLYADRIAPANVSVSGATATITGMGFRQGNLVLVNGVPAQGNSWSSNTIVAALPSMSAAHATATAPVDVEVRDLSTGGSTVMRAALLYGIPAPDVYAVSAVQPAAYVAEGSVVNWAAGVQVVKNGGPAVAQPVSWTSRGGGVVLASGQTLTDGGGLAQVQAALGPFSGGQNGTIMGCVSTTVCATVQVLGVASGDLRPLVVSGAAQIVTAADTLVPVTLEVTDLAGDPVMGAAVEVYQTVSTWQMACPERGRCPAGPVLGSSKTTLVSDALGRVMVLPLQISGRAEVTDLAAAVGTQGFASLTLVKNP